MKTLHVKPNNDKIFVPKEGQRGFACSNKKSLRCPSLSTSSFLSEETLDAIEELGGILKHIHIRMVKEGYDLIDGSPVNVYEKISC
jgi:hypothetical protein